MTFLYFAYLSYECPQSDSAVSAWSAGTVPSAALHAGKHAVHILVKVWTNGGADGRAPRACSYIPLMPAHVPVITRSSLTISQDVPSTVDTALLLSVGVCSPHLYTPASSLLFISCCKL